LEPSDEVKALAFTPGQQIAAIKLYREQTGADLMEAADVIQRLERSTYKVTP
jgi:ribosomal protein L7/L12